MVADSRTVLLHQATESSTEKGKIQMVKTAGTKSQTNITAFLEFEI